MSISDCDFLIDDVFVFISYYLQGKFSLTQHDLVGLVCVGIKGGKGVFEHRNILYSYASLVKLRSVSNIVSIIALIMKLPSLVDGNC